MKVKFKQAVVLETYRPLFSSRRNSATGELTPNVETVTKRFPAGSVGYVERIDGGNLVFPGGLTFACDPSNYEILEHHNGRAANP